MVNLQLFKITNEILKYIYLIISLIPHQKIYDIRLKPQDASIMNKRKSFMLESPTTAKTNYADFNSACIRTCVWDRAV